MESLAFVALVAALLVGLHAVVAAYLYRVALSGEPRPAEDAGPDRRAEATDAGADDALRCPVCGIINDQTYRFCRHCVADLTGQKAADGAVSTGRLGS